MKPIENEVPELKVTPEEAAEINARADALLGAREYAARLVGGADKLDKLLAEEARKETERKKPRPYALPPVDEINAFADRLLNARENSERILGRSINDLGF